MRINRSIKLNFIMNSLMNMSQFIFPLITFPYISRILMPEGTGLVSFASSVVMYFSMFAQLGIPTYGIRACAGVRDNKEQLSKTVHEIMIVNAGTCVLVYIFFGISLFMIPRFQTYRMLYIIMGSSILFNSIGMEWLYRALEEYTYIAIRSIVFKVIALIAMFLLVKNQSDYVIYGGITIFAASASNICNFVNVHKYISLKPMGGYHIKPHLKPIGIFFAMSCATTIYTNLDTVMLGFMKTNVDVGYYNASVKIKNVLISVVTSLGAVLLPRASYYIENGMMDEFRNISKKAIHFVFLLATPITVFFIVFAREGILFLCGNAYAGAIIPMQVIMPTILFIGLTNIMGMQMLIPMLKENVVLYSTVAGAMVDLIINALLIPHFASTGAAIGTLMAEFVVLVIQYIYLRSQLKEVYASVRYGKIIIAIVLAFLASVWTKKIMTGYFVILLVGACLFFGVYLLILNITKESFVMEIEQQVLGRFFGRNSKKNLK